MKKIILLVAMLFIGMPALVLAQDTDPYADRDAQFYRLFELQMVENLNSPVDQIRTETLQTIIFYATFHNDKVDLSSSVPEILEIFEREKSDNHRILALAALHAIGSEASMQYLAHNVEEERSQRVKHMMMTVLNNFYTANGDLAFVRF